MSAAWPAWVLWICVVAALLCMTYGGLRAMLAARVVKNHVDRMKALPIVAEVAKSEGYAARINADLAGIEELLVRANAAIRAINKGLAEMRIPEAIAAVRMAGAAIRLLFNSR